MAKSKRNTRGMGRIYKRINGKEYPSTSSLKGNYWIEYHVNGVRKRDVLRNEHGVPVRNLKDAEKERLRILTPMMKMSEKQTLEILKVRIEGVEDDLLQANKKLKPPLSLHDMWNAFEESHEYNAGERTLSDYYSKVHRLIEWCSKHDNTIQHLKDVTPEDAKAFGLYLRRKFSANTHNKYIVLLTHMFNVLAKDAQMEQNPFESVRKIPSRKMKAQMNSRRELSLGELKTVIDKAEGDLRILFVIGTYTGLRLGDCATLLWPEINMDKQMLSRKPLKTRNTTGKKVKIGIPESLIQILNEHEPRVTKRHGFVLPECALEYQRQKGAALVKRIQDHFHACDIETTRPGTGKEMDENTGKLKSTGVRAVTDVGFHSLRHTFVSLHAEAGTPQGVIRDLVGHGNVAMTEHYEHISDSTVIRCAKSLPSLLDESKLKSESKHQNIPDWIMEHLKRMKASNWKDICDELIASAG